VDADAGRGRIADDDVGRLATRGQINRTTGDVTAIRDAVTGTDVSGFDVRVGSARARAAIGPSNRLVTGVEPTADVAGRTASVVRDEARVGRAGVGTWSENMMVNGGGQAAELGPAEGWTQAGGYPLVAVDTDARIGDRCLEMGGPGVAASTAFQDLGSVVAGAVYEVCAWVRVVTPDPGGGGYAVLNPDIVGNTDGGAWDVLGTPQAPYAAGADVGLPLTSATGWTEIRVLLRARIGGTLRVHTHVGYSQGSQAVARFDGISVRRRTDYEIEGARRARRVITSGDEIDATIGIVGGDSVGTVRDRAAYARTRTGLGGAQYEAVTSGNFRSWDPDFSTASGVNFAWGPHTVRFGGDDVSIPGASFSGLPGNTVIYPWYDRGTGTSGWSLIRVDALGHERVPLGAFRTVNDVTGFGGGNGDPGSGASGGGTTAARTGAGSA
jgi:hypothetical protein